MRFPLVSRLLVTGPLVAFLGLIAMGQSPKQSAQIEKLGFYVGTWSATGKMRSAPNDSFMRLSGGETCSWVINRHAVECREIVKSKAGSSSGVYLLTWDTASSRYSAYGVDDAGTVLNAAGQLSRQGEWVWTVAQRQSTERSAWLYTFRPSGARARTFMGAIQTGKKWTPMIDVIYTRK